MQLKGVCVPSLCLSGPEMVNVLCLAQMPFGQYYIFLVSKMFNSFAIYSLPVLITLMDLTGLNKAAKQITGCNKWWQGELIMPINW